MSERIESGPSRLEESRARLETLPAGIDHAPVACADGMPCFEVPRESLPAAMEHLRDELGFAMSTIVTAVDLYPAEPRFRLVYQFLSLRHNDRVRVHCGVPSEDAWVPSIAGLWPAAGFFEREVYDMFGIRFEGHPDLRRLLMPEAYEHHPLRKDFPHQGIEPDKLYREWDQSRREPAGSES